MNGYVTRSEIANIRKSLITEGTAHVHGFDLEMRFQTASVAIFFENEYITTADSWSEIVEWIRDKNLN